MFKCGLQHGILAQTEQAIKGQKLNSEITRNDKNL